MGTSLICRRKKCGYVGGVSESGALIGQFTKHAKIISDGMYMLCFAHYASQKHFQEME